MQERRRSTRRTTARVLCGRVYFYVNNRRASLPCLIRDMAYEGARIILADRSNIPDEVDLLHSGKKTDRACQRAVATRRQNRARTLRCRAARSGTSVTPARHVAGKRALRLVRGQ